MPEEESQQNNDNFQENENVLDNFVDLRQSLNVEEDCGKPNTSHKKRSARSRS